MASDVGVTWDQASWKGTSAGCERPRPSSMPGATWAGAGWHCLSLPAPSWGWGCGEGVCVYTCACANLGSPPTSDSEKQEACSFAALLSLAWEPPGSL